MTGELLDARGQSTGYACFALLQAVIDAMSGAATADYFYAWPRGVFSLMKHRILANRTDALW